MYNLVSASEMFKDCFQYGYSSYYSYSYGNSQFDFDGGKMNSLFMGENMFQNCYGLTSVRASMTALQIGEQMFLGLDKLKTFSDYGLISSSPYSQLSENLQLLRNGDFMFAKTAFENVRHQDSGHVGELEYYGQYALNASFGYLTTAHNMFSYCKQLSSFECDLPYLVNASHMFAKTGLQRFYTSTLASMKTGAYMFYDDYTNTASGRLADSDILNIANVINNIYGLNKQDDSQWTYQFPTFKNPDNYGYSTLGNGDTLIDYYAASYDGAYYTTGSRITYYECTAAINPAYRGVIHLGSQTRYPQTSSTIMNACQILVNKGWTVYIDGYKAIASCFDCNGDVTSGGGITLEPNAYPVMASAIDITDDNGETITPAMYYYKPVPVSESIAKYVDQEGNYFIIMGGELVFGDDLENYGQFTSVEEAAANMGFTKYPPEMPEEEEVVEEEHTEEQSQPEEENA